jgi:hypothetical protein
MRSVYLKSFIVAMRFPAISVPLALDRFVISAILA